VRGSKSPVVSDAAALDGILPVLLTMMQSATGVLQSLGTCRGWSETVYKVAAPFGKCHPWTDNHDSVALIMITFPMLQRSEFPNCYAHIPPPTTMYVDLAYCYRPSCVVCRSVCPSVTLSVNRSVTLVSPAKSAEAIEMPCRYWAWMDPRNRLRWGPDPPCGKGQPIVSIATPCRELCKNG